MTQGDQGGVSPTETSPFVAGISRDAEVVYPGDTEDGAIGVAMAAEVERLECNGYELEPTVEVEVYEGVVWCTGAHKGGDCACGMSHEDHDGRWLMSHWERRTVRALDTTPWAPQGRK